MVGRQTIERWPFDGSSVAGAAVAAVATAEYVSGEAERRDCPREATLSGLDSPSLAAVTLHAPRPGPSRAVGDVPARSRRSPTVPRWPELDMPRWPSSSTSHTHRCRPTTDTSRRRCRRCARASRSRSASGRSSTRRGPARAWAGFCSESIPRRRWRRSASTRVSRRMTTRGNRSTIPSASRSTSDHARVRRAAPGDVAPRAQRPSPSSWTTSSNAARSRHARLVIDVAAVLAYRIGDDSWARPRPPRQRCQRRRSWAPGTSWSRSRPAAHSHCGRRAALATVVGLVAAAPPDAEVSTVPPPRHDDHHRPLARIGGRVAVTRRARARVGGGLPRGRVRDGPHLQGVGRSRRPAGLAGPRAPLPRSRGRGAQEASTGEVIDAAARRAYETRIRDLQEEVDDAELAHDLARAERAQAELDALVDHLTAAIGMGGRTAGVGTAEDRAPAPRSHTACAARFASSPTLTPTRWAPSPINSTMSSASTCSFPSRRPRGDDVGEACVPSSRCEIDSRGRRQRRQTVAGGTCARTSQPVPGQSRGHHRHRAGAVVRSSRRVDHPRPDRRRCHVRIAGTRHRGPGRAAGPRRSGRYDRGRRRAEVSGGRCSGRPTRPARA